jgi:hypothetical protein
VSPKIDLEENTGEAVKPEYFEHPSEGWVSYDPRTMYINSGSQGVKHHRPIALTGKFVGTKQPHVSTCSEPVEGNRGCAKWAGCPMKKFPYVGPGNVIMEKHGMVTFAPCYDYFETTRQGKPVSQLHYGMEGYKLDVSRTSVPVLGRTGAVMAGKLNEESSRQAVLASKAKVWEMEIGDLLPPWWGLMKRKGLPLPESAKMYPELVDDTEGPSKPKRVKKSK